MIVGPSVQVDFNARAELTIACKTGDQDVGRQEWKTFNMPRPHGTEDHDSKG